MAKCKQSGNEAVRILIKNIHYMLANRLLCRWVFSEGHTKVSPDTFKTTDKEHINRLW